MKYNKYITKGFDENLENVPFHNKTNFIRRVMLNNQLINDSNDFISIHNIEKIEKNKYCDLHKHNYDEINLILSENKSLNYEIKIENETYKVVSPATIYIPKGLKHSANVISGKGTFICIVLNGNYEAKE